MTEVLGRGGFSVVRQGIQKCSEGNTRVAIKTLRRFGPFMPSPGSRNSTNELLVMRKIVEDVSPHPNVVHLHDICEDSGGGSFDFGALFCG